MDNTQSVAKLSNVSGVSQTSVQRILKSHRFHSYKFQLVQHLNEADNDHRLQFWKEMSERLVNNPFLFYNICFSDECSFFLNAIFAFNWSVTAFSGCGPLDAINASSTSFFNKRKEETNASKYL